MIILYTMISVLMLCLFLLLPYEHKSHAMCHVACDRSHSGIDVIVNYESDHRVNCR